MTGRAEPRVYELAERLDCSLDEARELYYIETHATGP